MSEPTLISSIVHVRLYMAVERVVVQTQSNMDISLFRRLETGISMQHINTILDMVGLCSKQLSISSCTIQMKEILMFQNYIRAGAQVSGF